MDTDHIMSICAGVGITVCGLCAFFNAWRSSKLPFQGLKQSRSDTDLSMLQDVVTDSLPTHK